MCHLSPMYINYLGKEVRSRGRGWKQQMRFMGAYGHFSVV